MSKKYFFLILALFVLLLFLLVGVYLVRSRTYVASRAYTSVDVTSIGLGNSYLFASPLSAAVGGEKIRISVFILNNQGAGLTGKRVSLGQSPDVVVDAIQPTTDYLGKAIFDISSRKPGFYFIEAAVEGQTLPQRVSVTFK